MSRGFITIATGDKKYHEMAKTLVKSYKLTSASPMRFGVITDDANDKFEEFDDVVLIKDATRSYMDKIDIMRYSPYDETIFIDSDCIAFNNLNIYWKDFGGGGKTPSQHTVRSFMRTQTGHGLRLAKHYSIRNS